jgi:hypothetical protein
LSAHTNLVWAYGMLQSEDPNSRTPSCPEGGRL